MQYNVLTVSMPDPGGTAEGSFFLSVVSSPVKVTIISPNPQRKKNLRITVKKRKKILGFFLALKGSLV